MWLPNWRSVTFHFGRSTGKNVCECGPSLTVHGKIPAIVGGYVTCGYGCGLKRMMVPADTEN